MKLSLSAMSSEAVALAFPWGLLDRLSPSMARNWRALHRQLEPDGVAQKLSSALASWLGQPVRIERHRLRPMLAEPDGPPTRLRFRLPAGTGEITACFDSRLVTRLVGFALNHDVSFSDPLLPVDPSIIGAAAAIAAKIIEDAAIGFELEFASTAAEIDDAQRLQLDFTLWLGTTAYPVALGFILKWLPLNPSKREVTLDALGTLQLELPLVIGESLMARDELSRLAPGLAFLTGSGLWIDSSKTGRAVAIAPRSECGAEVHLRPDGKIVLGESVVTLNHSGPPSAANITETLADTLFDAPVVVRVEMGTVSLSAKDWAKLRPGDILETGQPLGADVILRVAGQAVAKGELLNVEGELGVRITKLLVGEEPR